MVKSVFAAPHSFFETAAISVCISSGSTILTLMSHSKAAAVATATTRTADRALQVCRKCCKQLYYQRRKIRHTLLLCPTAEIVVQGLQPSVVGLYKTSALIVDKSVRPCRSLVLFNRAGVSRLASLACVGVILRPYSVISRGKRYFISKRRLLQNAQPCSALTLRGWACFCLAGQRGGLLGLVVSLV